MKYLSKRYICILLAVLCCIVARAYDEVSHGSYPIKLPLSPNVAEFPQYGDVPVNHYTGTMTLNIPIYEIDVDGCKVPISLTYSATGIKVAQHASNVGLGWQLNCGGIITADCYGKNDFDCWDDGYVCNRYDYGVPDEQEIPKYSFSNWGTDISKTDTRPDIFHYSFCGNTGAMFFEPRHQHSPIPITQDKYLDITYSHDAQTWVIYDGNGNKYHFGNKYHSAANTVLANPSVLGAESTPGVEDNPNKGGCSWDYKSINAWPLDTIITSHGRRIIFRYKRESIATPMMGQEEVRIAYLNLCTNCLNCDIPWRSNYFSHISSTVIQSVISEIFFPNGRIQFYSSARKDVWAGMYFPSNTTDVDGGTKIDSIVVTGHSGRVIKRAVMHYHYAGNTSSPNTCRLMLDSITGLEERPYTFSYYNETLPKKNSKQIDMWGYYNASKAQKTWSTTWASKKEEEGTLMPSMVIDNKTFFGRDRQCNPQTIKNGTLHKVVYPTGGYSVFEYEPHTFSSVDIDAETIKEETVEKSSSLILNVDYRTTPSTISLSTPAKSHSITLDADDRVDIHASIHSLWGGPVDYGVPPIMAYVAIYSANGAEVERYELRLYKEEKIYDFQPKLSKGTYTIKLEYSGNTAANIPKPNTNYNVSNGYIYITETTMHRKKNNNGHGVSTGGGIRVKSITNYDYTGNIIQQRHYSYIANDSATSGLLMVKPRFSAPFEEEFLNSVTPTIIPQCFPMPCLLISSSMLANPKPMIQDAIVGYSMVQETTMPTQEYGRTEYVFRNAVVDAESIVSLNFNVVGFPYNGQLLQRLLYNGDDIVCRDETYLYTLKTEKNIKGWHTIKLFPERYYSAGNQQVPNLQIRSYTLTAYSTTDMTCRQTDYTDGGTITKTIVTQYDSINHLPLIQRTYVNGDTLTIRNMYAANSRSDKAVLLQNHYMYNAPLQQTEERNGSKSAIYDYIYAPYWRNVVLQQVRSTHNGTDSISSYIVKSVDGYGNPTCIETPSGVSVAYLWGCESLYPIVEVVGATYEQIKQAMGNEGFISMLQTNCDIFLPMLKTIYQELTRYVPKGNIHIRTYSPSVGILNEITTQGVVYSYEYDDYNRLKVKYMETDNGRIVMEQYDYHFREP